MEEVVDVAPKVQRLTSIPAMFWMKVITSNILCHSLGALSWQGNTCQFGRVSMVATAHIRHGPSLSYAILFLGALQE